jgi:dTDP-4-amino-4,6-dideoxygalactose transaminase
LALLALGIKQGDEVIVPSFTFFATASCVTRLGATPVFADIKPSTFNLDPGDVSEKITRKTKAIIPVHLFGQCADMAAFNAISEASGIPIIEDAAQAIGAEFESRRAGSLGTIGCLSFYPTKNLGGAGDGGMLTTNDDELADRLSLYRVHGMRPRYYHDVVGINSRLDSFQAAILNIKMQHLDEYARRRRENADRYTKLFTEAGLDQKIGLPVTLKGRGHVWNQYTIRVPGGRRDDLRAFLNERNIGAEIYYPLGLHDQKCFEMYGYKPGDLPETERAAGEVLALPIFPELTAAEQEIVVGRIAEFLGVSTGTAPLSGPKFMKKTDITEDA